MSVALALTMGLSASVSAILVSVHNESKGFRRWVADRAAAEQKLSSIRCGGRTEL